MRKYVTSELKPKLLLLSADEQQALFKVHIWARSDQRVSVSLQVEHTVQVKSYFSNLHIYIYIYI